MRLMYFSPMSWLACFVFTFALGTGPAAAQTKIKVAEGSRSFTVMPLYIAMDAGYFAEQGLSVDLVTMKGGPAAVGALLSGDVDVTFSVVETAIKMRGQGKDLRVAALMQDKNPSVLVVPATSPAKSLADLKGKKIGVTATGSLTDLVIRNYIRRLGLPSEDFEIVGLGSGATVAAALERGLIHAAVTFTPFLTKMEMDKRVRVLYDFRKEVYPGQALLVRGADLGGPREAILVKFVAALAKGAKTLHEDLALATKVGRVYFPDMESLVLETMIRSETREIPVFSKDTKLSRADFDTLTEVLVGAKLITKGEKYEDIVIDFKR